MDIVAPLRRGVVVGKWQLGWFFTDAIALDGVLVVGLRTFLEGLSGVSEVDVVKETFEVQTFGPVVDMRRPSLRDNQLGNRRGRG